MDILDEGGVAGVFFMLGEKVEMYPEVVADVAARGHHAANHLWVHELMTDHDSETLAGWIGGACAVDEDCLFEDGVCVLPVPMDGDEQPITGICSTACTKYCPDDLDHVLHYQTFCVEVIEGEGHCLPKWSIAVPCQDDV